ncbi:MAG: hypothetical protein AMXMBFR20_19220 [Planctomycetia bacterium]
MTEGNAKQTPGSVVPLSNISTASEEEKAKARKFFEHAKKAGETRNYDYAVKLYTDGLAIWPEAVEEGLKPLWAAAMARKLDGGKPAGFLAARKLPVNDKNPLKNLGNALHLFGLDPSSITHMENILWLATQARRYLVVWWIVRILVQAYDTGKKLPATNYSTACQAMDAAAELAIQGGDAQIQMDILSRLIDVTQIWNRHYPDSMEAPKVRSNASGKLTITKGRFTREGTFVDSLLDGEAQQDIRDRDAGVRPEERLRAMIAKAHAEWQANREVPNKLLAVIDLMTRLDDPQSDGEAINLLDEEYKSSKNYIFKARADDVRIRMSNRRLRALKEAAAADPANKQAQEQALAFAAKQNDVEIAIFTERVATYPTDMKHKFQLGVRLFKANRFDEAIPLFQLSQMDGRSKHESRLYLGRCFFEKNFMEQAVSTLSTAIEGIDVETGKLATELNYWLGRGLEQLQRFDEARKVYGHLIQIDYNYRDARQRLQKLVAG